MDSRLLPFAMPGVGSEEEEAIALLSSVADDLLRDHHRAVEGVRQQARRLSNGILAVALVAFGLFVVQDFETAPITTLLIPAAVSLVALALGVGLRTWWVEAERFAPPQLLRAQKLSWQWLATPVGEDRLNLWDTLTDETLTLDLPPNPPKRPNWLDWDFGALDVLEEEKLLINRLGGLLSAWEEPSTPTRLPRLSEPDQPLLETLANLPRSRRWQPAPALPPARPLDQALRELDNLLRLHRDHRLYQRQLSAAQESILPFKASLERALRAARPSLEAPPAPPSAHPSADVERLIASLEAVRATAIETLRVPLEDDLLRQRDEMTTRLDVLQKDWERDRSRVHSSRDISITSLQTQIEELDKRDIPEAERALKEAQLRHREAADRVTKSEAELADKRKQLLLAGSASDKSPRASDDRKRDLNAHIERLNSILPEQKRGVVMLDEVVATQRGAVERLQRQRERWQQEWNNHTQQRDQELARSDQRYEDEQGRISALYAPTSGAIEADLAFFARLVEKCNAALSPYRVDLIMDDETSRPYPEVTQQTYQITEQKLAAVGRWADRVMTLIRQRRDVVERIVVEIEAATVHNFGLQEQRLMVLPVWYVESRAGQAALWPWQRRAPTEQGRLLAPFILAKGGERLALVDKSGGPLFLAPLPVLQRRLDALLAGERGAALREAARQTGLRVAFDPGKLDEIALACQMPRAMLAMLRPLHTGTLGAAPAPARVPVAAPDMATPDDSDEWVPAPALAASADAWEEDEPAPADDDGWRDEPPSPNGATPDGSAPRAEGEAQPGEARDG